MSSDSSKRGPFESTEDEEDDDDDVASSTKSDEENDVMEFSEFSGEESMDLVEPNISSEPSMFSQLP